MSEELVLRRRYLAMVATEAAMAREQDPVRYARLERRNALLVPGGMCGPAPFVGHEVADALWLKQVGSGQWTPDHEFSNCLGLAPLHHVVLVVAAGGKQVVQLVLPENAAAPTTWDFELPLMMPMAANQFETCALGGAAAVQLAIAQDGSQPSSSFSNVSSSWEGTFSLNTTRNEYKFALQDGVPDLRRVDGRLVRLLAASAHGHGCRAAGTGWNCCACGCNNHNLRNGCRECKHERCGLDLPLACEC